MQWNAPPGWQLLNYSKIAFRVRDLVGRAFIGRISNWKQRRTEFYSPHPFFLLFSMSVCSVWNNRNGQGSLFEGELGGDLGAPKKIVERGLRGGWGHIGGGHSVNAIYRNREMPCCTLLLSSPFLGSRTLLHFFFGRKILSFPPRNTSSVKSQVMFGFN